MLPSFRLIAAAFLGGFVLVFAGLHLIASLHVMNRALPVMTAQASALPIADASAARTAPAAVPVLFDLRFVASAIATAPIPAIVTPQAIDGGAAAASALAADHVVREPIAAPAATRTEADDATVPAAAIDPQAAAGAASAGAQATADAQPEQSQPPEVAAVDTWPTPSADAAEQPSIVSPSTSVGAEPPASTATVPQVPEFDPSPSAATAIADPKPPAARTAAGASDKSALRKRARTARRSTAKNGFGNSFGAPSGN